MAYSLGGCRSIQLSYERIFFLYVKNIFLSIFHAEERLFGVNNDSARLADENTGQNTLHRLVSRCPVP